MTEWVEEAVRKGWGRRTTRDVMLETFAERVDLHREQGFYDVEVAQMIKIKCQDSLLWPMYRYWCCLFLDWEDEPPEGEIDKE